MIHALLYLVFILPFTYWLGHELKLKFSLKTHWPLLATAVAIGLIASFSSKVVGGPMGNFLLHGIGGGIASSFLFLYVLRTLEINQTWRLELLFLICFVSVLGVMNEIGEYVIELFHWAVMSVNTHDTWRDLVANTSGALVSWLVIKIIMSKITPGQKTKNNV